ncbi:hypothetical protein LPJ56_006847, partial [Coemansia sp. RSA 2599]
PAPISQGMSCPAVHPARAPTKVLTRALARIPVTSPMVPTSPMVLTSPIRPQLAIWQRTIDRVKTSLRPMARPELALPAHWPYLQRPSGF